MDTSSLLLELYGRIPALARQAVEGVELSRLTEPPAPGANTIAWLVWHLARVQDHHVADVLDADQLWTEGGWADRFGLDADPSNTGYGHSEEQAAAVRPQRPEVLVDYLEAVDRRTPPCSRTSPPQTSTASSIQGGTHPSPWGCGW